MPFRGGDATAAPKKTPSALVNAPLPQAPAPLAQTISHAVSGVGQAVRQATPKPTPSLGSVGQAVTQASHAVVQAGAKAAQNTANPSSDSYKNALISVYQHQTPQGKTAIVQGALRNPQALESQTILQYVHQNTPASVFGNRGLEMQGVGKSAPLPLAALLKTVLKGPQPVNIGGNGGGNGLLAAAAVPNQVGAMFGSGTGKKIVENTGKDILDFFPETFATIGTLGGDVLKGNFKKLGSDLINPIIQTAEHPVKSFINHPFDMYLMAEGGLGGLTRAAAAPIRALAPESALGKLVSTDREGVALTGNLTHERAPFSKTPSVKVKQAALDSALYKRAPNGDLVPRSEQLRARQINQEMGSIVGTRERIRRVNQEQEKHAHNEAINPGLAKRAAGAAKNTLKYNPKAAAIPGADVLSRIADATIRKPETVEKDLQKHIADVASKRPELTNKTDIAQHDAYIDTLQKALRNKKFIQDPAPAFKAALEHDAAYTPRLQAEAHALGHFGQMDKEGLLRRQLMHYAVTHMGAKFDDERGLVDAKGDPIPTQEILDHLKGPEGTGGRIPTYTPDRVSSSNSSWFVSSEDRPTPTTHKTTLFNFTHGLTDPSHEPLLEQRALMRGIVDSHRSQNAYAEAVAHTLQGGKYGTYQEAMRASRGTRMKPINIAKAFHPQDSLDEAISDLHAPEIEEEAIRHSLDLSGRMKPSEGGRWGLADPHALRALNAHRNQISPNALMRTIRGLNNQFRTVALSTSAKHVPGVAQENVIRDIAAGVGMRSWITGRRILKRAEQIDPVKGKELRVAQTGGQVAGMTEAAKTYRVSDHWYGTSAYPFLKAMEGTFKAPGVRQLRTAWRAWSKLAINGTKHILEEQHQIAGIGKAALREHGFADAARVDGFMGVVHRAWGLQGKMLDDAAQGLFDPAKSRQMRATVNQIYGKWTDLSPSAQTALMFSPFGLWWVNSAKFLARTPIDQPIKSGLLASATVGTHDEREKEGLTMFSPNSLPGYLQGGIPVGSKILAQNYYSPFGVLSDPLETGIDLLAPWQTPIVEGIRGLNWLGEPLQGPGFGYKQQPNDANKIQYVLNSIMGSFVPMYQKAEQIASGGASTYDVNGPSPLPSPIPATKPGPKSVGAGISDAIRPVRTFNNPNAAPSKSGGYLLAPTKSSGGYLLKGPSGGKKYMLGG